MTPGPIRVCIAGVTGWTGSAVAAAVRAAADLELAAGVSRSDSASYSSVAEALDAVDADVVVDYTHASVVKQNVLAAVGRGVNVVVGSSGLSGDDYAQIDAAATERGVGVVAAGNFSITAAVLLKAAVEAARHLDRWEVLDYASAGKPDAPSGTARELAERLGEVRAPRSGSRCQTSSGRARRGERRSPAPRFTRCGSELQRLDRGRLRGAGRAPRDSTGCRRVSCSLRRRHAAGRPVRRGTHRLDAGARPASLPATWTRRSVVPRKSSTQASPKAERTTNVTPPTWIVSMTALVAGSMRVTVPFPWFGIHSSPSGPRTPSAGFVPTLIVATTRFVEGSRRETVPFWSLESQTAPGCGSTQSTLED